MPNSPIDSQIRSRVDAFVTEVSGLVRGAALEAVSAALGNGSAVSAPRRSAKKAGRRARSSGADISDAVLAHVRSNPGSRAEQIMDALGANGDDVKRALVALKASKAVKARGKARGTNYVAGGRGGGGAKKTGRKASRKKGGRRGKRAGRKAARKTSSKTVAEGTGLVWT